MDVDSNANTNEDAPPPTTSHPHSPTSRRGGNEHLESASRAADLMGTMKTEDRAAGKVSAATNKTATTNHESCTATVISDMHVPGDPSSDNQQDKADMSKSANDSNIASFTSTVRADNQPTQSDNNLDAEEHPDKHTEHTKRKSIDANDAIAFKVGPGSLLPPSFIGIPDNETEEDRQRRRAVFAAKRQRHVLADNLHAHYEAILAAVGVDEGGEQQEPQPQQYNNNGDNAASFCQNASRPGRHVLSVAMDLFRDMGTDDESE